jgi:5-formyltetrahydrofolate cyclo-ligase
MSLPKQVLREKIWRRLKTKKVARFPGARGRIPNFTGAEVAAQQLITFPFWLSAQTIKCNPDSPQRHVRYAALREGKCDNPPPASTCP